RTCASGRSGSTLLTGSTSSASASSTTHSSPLSMATGSTRTDACAAAGTARTAPRGGQSRVDRIGGDHPAGGKVVQQLGVGVVGRDKRACDRRRNERSRHRAVAELSQDNSQFEDAEALSTNGFRQVHALQALIGRGLPEWWWVRYRGFEGFVQHIRWRHPRHQGPYRIGQVVVLRTDRDRHSYLFGPSLLTGRLGASVPVDHVR